MSFSRNAKLEALQVPLENDCCYFAFLCGLLLGVGHIEIDKKEIHLSLITDIQELYDYINDIIHSLYGEYAELEITDEYKINKTTYYKITFPKDISKQIAVDAGFVNISNDYTLTVNQTIPERMIIEDCCKKAFVKGAFLSCATTNIKINSELNARTSSGYHLEFSNKKHQFLQTVSEILASYDIFAKLIERKNIFVLYVKEASQISDILALTCSYNSVLELSNEIAIRELRNKVNRQTNCENANIMKTVDASYRQMESITLINEVLGLENLPADLQVVALLRIANPEESLSNLLKLSKLDITKSGLNHRLKKLEKIANDLK